MPFTSYETLGLEIKEHLSLFAVPDARELASLGKVSWTPVPQCECEEGPEETCMRMRGL